MVSQKMSYIKWCLLKITLQALFLNVQMTSVHISSDRTRSSSNGLVLHQMVFAEKNTLGPVPQCLVPQCQFTSDHNSSELVIQDHNNEQSSSKLVPKAVP
ncbi:hypothetical protein Tco_0882209 [Tanacetum coccineum]